ncbi:hypothetical protein [Staphylococcus sp. LKG3-3]|uniref:hypothetical protein n=1 Tax=Staphylococcus sp. LKG3-3 TaxID=3399685 RepID=UPI003D50FA12
MNDDKSKAMRTKILLTILEGASYQEWQDNVKLINKLFKSKAADETLPRKRIDTTRKKIDKQQ